MVANAVARSAPWPTEALHDAKKSSQAVPFRVAALRPSVDTLWRINIFSARRRLAGSDAPLTSGTSPPTPQYSKVKMARLSKSGEGNRSVQVRSGIADGAMRIDIGARSIDGVDGLASSSVALGMGSPTVSPNMSRAPL